MSKPTPAHVKIILLGDPNVPTREVHVALHQIPGKISRSDAPTDPLQIEMTVKGQYFSASFWPAITLPDYDRLRPLVYPRTDLFALAYDPHQPSTIESIEPKWLKEARHHMPHAAVCVVALESSTSAGEGPQVSDKEGRDLARKIEAEGFLRVDTKDANEIFVKKLLEIIVDHWEKDKNRVRPGKSADRKQGRCIVS